MLDGDNAVEDWFDKMAQGGAHVSMEGIGAIVVELVLSEFEFDMLPSSAQTWATPYGAC